MLPSRRPADQPALSARRFPSLDGYRGLAFLLIFARHYGLSSHIHSTTIHRLEHWAAGGWVGVDLFFALSGFFITGILLDTTGHPHYLRNFFARRTLRIFPLYYGVAILLAALTPVLHLQWRPGHLLFLVYLGNLAFCLDPTLSTVQPAVSLLHLWSLAIEEQFYLLWPGVIYLLARTGHRRRLLPLCLALSGIGFALRLTLLLHLRDVQNAFNWNYAMLPMHMDGLLFGAIAALLLRTQPAHRLHTGARWAAIAAAAALLLIVVHSGPDIYSRAMSLFGLPLLAILFSSVILLALPQRSFAGRLGNLRPLRFFGRYSYGMYVFHLLFWPASARLLPVLQRFLHSGIAGGLGYVALMLAATTAVAVLSYRFYERPWLRLKTRFADHPASPDPVVAS